MTAEPEFEFKRPRATPRKRMTRKEALAAIEAGAGSRPDLPPGEVFVRKLRGARRAPVPESMLAAGFREWGSLPFDEAVRNIRKGAGSRPDLPSGVEYLDHVRHVWQGLIPRG